METEITQNKMIKYYPIFPVEGTNINYLKHVKILYASNSNNLANHIQTIPHKRLYWILF